MGSYTTLSWVAYRVFKKSGDFHMLILQMRKEGPKKLSKELEAWHLVSGRPRI